MKRETLAICNHIKDMIAYVPVQPSDAHSRDLGLPVEKIIKLDANENPYAPPGKVRSALAEMKGLNLYPDPESRALRAALAEYHRVPVENILAGAGADDLIDLVMRLFIEPGDVIINCPPTFGMYVFDADLQRARVINVQRGVDFCLDIQAIEKAIGMYQPKLLFLASPNNPDGSLILPGDLERLLDLPVVVVLDEAYIEFAPAGCSRICQAAKRENLIVLRTFSKWAGLAGLRVGYGVFPGWMMPYLWKIKQPYTVSAAASTAGVVSIENAAELNSYVEMINAERGRFYQKLESIPLLEPYPSEANFILCRTAGRSARRVWQQLATHGILVRYFDKPGVEDCIRISIGTPDQMAALLVALDEIKTGE